MKKMYKVEGNIPFWIMIAWFFLCGFATASIKIGALIGGLFGWT